MSWAECMFYGRLWFIFSLGHSGNFSARPVVDAMHSGALTQGSLLYCSQNLIQCQTCLLSPAPGARGECISSSCFNHYLLINFPVYGILYCISIVLFVYIFFSMFNWSEATTSARHMSVMGALKRFHQIGQRKHNTSSGQALSMARNRPPLQRLFDGAPATRNTAPPPTRAPPSTI